MLSLATPWWLLALPLPWLAWQAAQIRNEPSNDAVILHPQTELLFQLSQQKESRKLPWLWFLACALFLLALARPQWIDENQTQGRNILLTLDTSSSMRTQDFVQNDKPTSRMEIVKQVVNDFIGQRQGDRIGLVVFGDDAFTLAPLTTDLDLIRHHLNNVDNGIAGQKTALGQAIALGVKRLQLQDDRSRIMILLTDGSNTSGEIHPLNALSMAKDWGVRIYAVGIGSDKKALFPRGPVQQPDFKAVPMDEALLQQIAEESGGRYYHAMDTDELSNIVNDIEQLESIKLPSNQQQKQEWYFLPLLLGLLFIAAARWQQQREVMP